VCSILTHRGKSVSRELAACISRRERNTYVAGIRTPTLPTCISIIALLSTLHASLHACHAACHSRSLLSYSRSLLSCSRSLLSCHSACQSACHTQGAQGAVCFCVCIRFLTLLLRGISHTYRHTHRDTQTHRHTQTTASNRAAVAGASLIANQISTVPVAL